VEIVSRHERRRVDPERTLAFDGDAKARFVRVFRSCEFSGVLLPFVRDCVELPAAEDRPAQFVQLDISFAASSTFQEDIENVAAALGQMEFDLIDTGVVGAWTVQLDRLGRSSAVIIFVIDEVSDIRSATFPDFPIAILDPLLGNPAVRDAIAISIAHNSPAVTAAYFTRNAPLRTRYGQEARGGLDAISFRPIEPASSSVRRPTNTLACPAQTGNL